MSCHRIPGGIVTIADEIDATGIDLRTREGREREVLEQVRQFGGFTVFWVTANQKRAWAADRLTTDGRIVCEPSHAKHAYPWCVYRLATPTPNEKE